MTAAATDLAAATGPLLGPGDPPPFAWARTDGRSPVLLLADHAGNRVPQALGRLGLGDAALGLHIAYDIGIEWVTRRLALLLDAPALLHRYSRLVVDPNRRLDDPTAICAVSDGVLVPGNRDVGPEEAGRRADAVWHPYHGELGRAIERFLGRGIAPALVSMHSFTPRMRGFERPWHVGILWDGDGRIAVPLMAALRAEPGLCVGDNQPYDGRDRHGYTLEAHAVPRGLAHVLIEIRQDEIATEASAVAWAERLATPLGRILSDGALFRPGAGA